MAIRLEDEDERISNLVKLFFHEFSKKGNNPIYNLLPDILSKLSQQNLKKDSFCNIMQFLIGFIKKSTGGFIAVLRYASATPMLPSVLSRGVGWQVWLLVSHVLRILSSLLRATCTSRKKKKKNK